MPGNVGELNWSKTVALRINHDGVIFDPYGSPVKAVEQTIYLGGLITANGAAQPEVSRRIGEAKGIFKAMQRCWSHANISRHRKIELYTAIVLPKLLYNIDSIWLLQADKRRLDGFHARCLLNGGVVQVNSNFCCLRTRQRS